MPWGNKPFQMTFDNANLSTSNPFSVNWPISPDSYNYGLVVVVTLILLSTVYYACHSTLQGYTNTKRESSSFTSDSSNSTSYYNIMHACYWSFTIIIERPRYSDSIVLSSDGKDPMEISTEDVIGIIAFFMIKVQ
jgi:hypothetical protein